MYRITNWINEGSGWVTELIDTEYVHISIYSPLSGSIYIELTRGLENSIKVLIKTMTINAFFWHQIRHLNPLNTHSERTTKEDINMVNDLDYEGIEFHLS